MTDETQSEELCRKCGETLAASARFCPACGVRAGTDILSLTHLFAPKPLLLSFGFGALLWAAIWFPQATMLGTRPTEVYKPPQNPAEQQAATYQDPDIERLRGQTKLSPDDSEAWRQLARKVLEKMRAGVIPPRAGALDAIDALSNVLRLKPQDTEALLLSADLSFENRAFAKAKELYQRYLELKPDHRAIRARYGSTLTFLSQHDEAIAVLKDLVIEEPENFQARAFLAIAYGQNGEKEQGLAEGKRALELAPTDEARERFSQFLKSLEITSPELESSREPKTLTEYLRGNPIAGPKFVRSEQQGSAFRAYFRDFPMDKMPPFAKEKFFSGIRSFLREKGESTLKEVVFLDSESGTELARLSALGSAETQ